MIERRVINGRPCSIAYFDENSKPVDKTTPGHYARILFDDGTMLTLKAPDSDQAAQAGSYGSRDGAQSEKPRHSGRGARQLPSSTSRRLKFGI